MVKKILCALLVLMMAGLASVALAEYCEHGSEQSPCDIGWQVDHFGQQHRRVCTNHVEEKEDPFSYMPVTEWQPVLRMRMVSAPPAAMTTSASPLSPNRCPRMNCSS